MLRPFGWYRYLREFKVMDRSIGRLLFSKLYIIACLALYLILWKSNNRLTLVPFCRTTRLKIPSSFPWRACSKHLYHPTSTHVIIMCRLNIKERVHDWSSHKWNHISLSVSLLDKVTEDEDSVNRSRMDIWRKTCDIRTWGRHLFLDISSAKYWYNYLIALPVRRNPRNRNLLTVVSATSSPPFQTLRHQRNISHPAVNRFTRQTIPIVNRKSFFMNILCLESFCSQKASNRKILFGSTLKHNRHFDY
jgi:hypothetical protein